MKRLAGIVLLASMTACLGLADEPGQLQSSVTAGSPEAVGILRFLNGPDATFEILDVDAGLDRRAAQNIVDHVRGADGLLGTADDDPIGDLDELDGIYWVGPAAIDHLLAYVESIGGVPTVDVEGVLMTADEAALVVTVVNQATDTQLDIDAALDARAARNLVAARPLADIDAVAAVSWVGPSALEKLRVYAPTWTAPTPPPVCTTSVGPRTDDDVARYNELLARATTLDWPYAEMVADQAPACIDLTSSATRADLVQALRLDSGLDWQQRVDFYPGSGALTPGSTGYLSLMAAADSAIQDAVTFGRWNPNATPEDAALWADHDRLYNALTARAAADPNAFYEVVLTMDAEECSQKAYALVDAQDLRIWIIHRFPGC